jgi:hypothetical protein
MSNDREQSLTVLVWERCPSKYSGTALVLLLKLAGLSAREGHAFPSMERLASMCGVTSRALRYIIEDLKKDRVLRVKGRKGHSNHFYLQPDEIRKLPLVIAPKEPVEKVQPEAPAASPRDAAWLAKSFETAMRRDLTDPVIPADWQARWTAQLQDLFDAGHDVELLVVLARFALKHAWWSMEIGKLGASVFVDNFDLIRRQFEKAA